MLSVLFACFLKKVHEQGCRFYNSRLILIGRNQCGPLACHLVMSAIIINWIACADPPSHLSLNLLKSLNFEKVFRFLAVADNKDKLLKLLQYVVKLIIVTRGYRKSTLERAADLKSFAATISLARKLGRIGNWLPGIQDLHVLAAAPARNFVRLVGATASVGNDLLDDWICLQKSRLLSKKSYLDILDLWSTRLWFISVSVDLNLTLKKLKEMGKWTELPSDEFNKKRTDLVLTASKQLCDWTFCVWELADLGRYNEQVPVIAGLCAAAIGAIRGWHKIKI